MAVQGGDGRLAHVWQWWYYCMYKYMCMVVVVYNGQRSDLMCMSPKHCTACVHIYTVMRVCARVRKSTWVNVHVCVHVSRTGYLCIHMLWFAQTGVCVHTYIWHPYPTRQCNSDQGTGTCRPCSVQLFRV